MNPNVPLVPIGLFAIGFYMGFKAIRTLEGGLTRTPEGKRVMSPKQRLSFISFLAAPVAATLPGPEGPAWALGQSGGAMFGYLTHRQNRK